MSSVAPPKKSRQSKKTTAISGTEQKNEVVVMKVPAPKANTEYYIHSKWSKASFMKNVIDSIKDMIKQTNMDWDEGGIHIQGMDGSHIALTNVFISKDDCEFYSIKESITLGVDLIRLSKILSIADSNDSLEFYIKSDEDAVINLAISSDDGKKRSHFEIPLLEIDTETMELPDMDYEGETVLNASEFAGAVRDLTFLGDNISIWIEDGELRIQVRDSFGMGEKAWKDVVVGTEGCPDNTKQQYSIKYMTMILKGDACGSTVHLHISKGSPIKIAYTFGNGSWINGYIAPKLEEDD